MIDVNWNPSRRDLRQFAGIWLPLFAAFAGGVIVYRSGSWRWAEIVWAAGAAASVLGLAIPGVARALFVVATVLAFPIGWVVSHVVMAATYYLIVTPIGFVMRKTGRDPLQRTEKRRSYWFRHETGRDPASYFRQF